MDQAFRVNPNRFVNTTPNPHKKNRRPDQTDVLAAEFQKVQGLRQDLSEPPPDVNTATPTVPQTTASPSSVIDCPCRREAAARAGKSLGVIRIRAGLIDATPVRRMIGGYHTRFHALIVGERGRVTHATMRSPANATGALHNGSNADQTLPSKTRINTIIKMVPSAPPP